MPKILNAAAIGRRTAREGEVFVGRPSKWGNPHLIGRDGSREDVVRKYRAWILKKPELLAALLELRGKDLICFCAPQRCHAEVLIELANGTLGAALCAFPGAEIVKPEVSHLGADREMSAQPPEQKPRDQTR